MWVLCEAVLARGDWPLLYDKLAISNTYSHAKNRNDIRPITLSKVAFLESGFSAVATLGGGWLQSPASDGPPCRVCQSNCIRVASSLAWRQHRRSCGVFKSWISVAHCPFQRKWRVLHIRYISVLEQVGMSFNGIAYLMKVYLLFKREFPRVLMTWHTARALISNVRSPM